MREVRAWLVRAWRSIAGWLAPAHVDPAPQPPSLGPYRDAATAPLSRSLRKGDGISSAGTWQVEIPDDPNVIVVAGPPPQSGPGGKVTITGGNDSRGSGIYGEITITGGRPHPGDGVGRLE